MVFQLVSNFGVQIDDTVKGWITWHFLRSGWWIGIRLDDSMGFVGQYQHSTHIIVVQLPNKKLSEINMRNHDI